MPVATTLRYEWVSEAPAFLGLRDQWNLLGSSTISTIFLTHSWLASWLTEIAPDAELHVLTAWDAERLVAALPLFGSPELGRGRRWAFMGSGTLTPNHLDVIAEPGFLDEARAEFARMLLLVADRWDTLEFNKLPADTATAEFFLDAFTRTGLSAHRDVTAICPYCTLPATFEEYVASLGKRGRKNLRNKLRNFEERAQTASLSMASTKSEALDALEALVRMHQARWTARGYPGAFADPRVVRFHRAMVNAAFDDGTLRMSVVRDGDEVVAVSYDFRIGNLMQAYLSSFDPRWDDWSPGQIVRAYIIKQAIAEGATRFDFLEGTEQYKTDWCPLRRENLRVGVFGRTLAGQLARVGSTAETTSIRLARRWVPPKWRERTIRLLASRSASRRPEEGNA